MQPSLSLLELPDLALQHIASHLPPADLANCMLSCTTLHVLLRPRLGAMVRARSMGCRWALRACGRAIFADVGRHYKAGLVGPEIPGGLPVDWEARCALGQWVAANGPSQSRLCADLKGEMKSVSSRKMIAFSNFAYVISLSQSRGFVRLSSVLEMVLERTTGCARTGPGWDMLQQLRVLEAPDFSFRLFTTYIVCLKFFPGPELLWAKSGSVYNLEMLARLSENAIDLLGVEVLHALFFMDFVEMMHFPLYPLTPTLNGPIPMALLLKIFGNLFGLSQQ